MLELVCVLKMTMLETQKKRTMISLCKTKQVAISSHYYYAAYEKKLVSKAWAYAYTGGKAWQKDGLRSWKGQEWLCIMAETSIRVTTYALCQRIKQSYIIQSESVSESYKRFHKIPPTNDSQHFSRVYRACNVQYMGLLLRLKPQYISP